MPSDLVTPATLAAGLASGPTMPFIDGTPEGQVGRLYQAAFGRLPDDAGVAYWATDLEGGDTLVNVASGFVASAEFQTRYGNPTSSAFVTSLYQNVLHREPDAGGLAYWSATLDSGGFSRAQVLVSFSESAENKAGTPASQNAQAATRLYYTVLGRTPDNAGITFWTSELSNHNLQLTDESDQLLTSAEFLNRNGTVDDATFVNLIYQNALGRAADPGGLGSWVGQIAGGTGRYSVAVAISESAEAKARFAPVTNQPNLLVTV